MKKHFIVFGLFAFIGLLAGCNTGEVENKEVDIKQISYGAVQIFEAQRQIRLDEFQQAMAEVGPYLAEGVTNIESRKTLLGRLDNVRHACRLANALAAMNGSIIPAMRLVLHQHGESDKAIEAALPRLFGELEPSKNAVLFAKYDVLFEAMKGLYAYLDLHWEKWNKKKDSFKDKELNAGYQRLINEMGDAINLMSEDEK